MVRAKRKQKISRNFRNPKIYYSGRARVKEKKDINYPLFFRIFFLTILVIGVLYLLFYSNVFRIKKIIVQGNSLIAKEKIEDSVPRNSNLILLKDDQLKKKIKQDVPEIKDIQVYKGFPDALKIVILEHDQSMVWLTGGNYYLVDSQGILYKNISDKLAEYKDFPRVEDKHNVRVEIGDKVASSSFVAFVNNIYSTFFKEVNIEPDYFSIAETTVDVNLYTKAGFYIKFDSLRSSKKEINNAKKVLSERRDQIKEYVDLRVDGWAYYK